MQNLNYPVGKAITVSYQSNFDQLEESISNFRIIEFFFSFLLFFNEHSVTWSDTALIYPGATYLHSYH